MYVYLTLEETIRHNGERHLSRAIGYIAAGYPDHYADGSLKKAIKNFKKADDVTIKSMPFFDALNEQIANNIAAYILNGDNECGGKLGLQLLLR